MSAKSIISLRPRIVNSYAIFFCIQNMENGDVCILHKKALVSLLFLSFPPILKNFQKKVKKGLTIMDLCSIIDKLTAESGAIDH